MKVFISWSGERSRETAECLRTWIRQVIQAADTWISTDIQKGSRWNDQIKNELEQSKIGIFCLDTFNLQSEWILFEAGAISKTDDAQVCTFLLDINPADIKLPLGQFQHTEYNQEDIRRLLFTINKKIYALGEKSISEKDLNETFEVWYPILSNKLNKIKNKKHDDGITKRTDREILEELLQTVRSAISDENKNSSHVINLLRHENDALKIQLLEMDQILRRTLDLSVALSETGNVWKDLSGREIMDVEIGDIIEHQEFGKGEIIKFLARETPHMQIFFQSGKLKEVDMYTAEIKKLVKE